MFLHHINSTRQPEPTHAFEHQAEVRTKHMIFFEQNWCNLSYDEANRQIREEMKMLERFRDFMVSEMRITLKSQISIHDERRKTSA